MATRGTVVIDIIGTCFSLEKPRQKLIELGATPYTLQLWFAQTLRDAFAYSHAGRYLPLKEVLEAELPRTLKVLGIEANAEQRSQIVKSFSELDLQPEALYAFKTLTAAGFQLIALTNGSAESTQKLLENAGAIQHFERILSCDAVQKTKPHPEVYEMAKQNVAGDIWMVAAHAWDIAGAATAGLKTAFITQEEKEYLSVYPQPEIIADSLLQAANKIVL